MFRRGRWKRWVQCLLVLALLLFGFLYWASRTVSPSLADGVTKQHLRLPLVGRDVSVTLYFPKQRENAPLVVVAHGFTRSKRYMASWGADLAAQGFLVAVPTQPALADHALNGKFLGALVDHLRLQHSPPSVALMGHSMGGLTTLLATQHTKVDAWVGLDPVDMSGQGRRVATSLQIPTAVLCAEPEAWNLHGNGEVLAKALSQPKLAIKVKGATHLDAESPTDLLGQLVCGFVDPSRQAQFKRYASAFLRATLLKDTAAEQELLQASNNPKLVSLKPTAP